MATPRFVLAFTQRLRAQGVVVLPQQLLDLHGALQAGLGWTGPEWRVICAALFATDERERSVVDAALTDLMPDSHLHELPEPEVVERGVVRRNDDDKKSQPERTPHHPASTDPSTRPLPVMPPPSEPTTTPPRETVLEGLQETGVVPLSPGNADFTFVLTPRFPVGERVARQMGRYLRLPVRTTDRWHVDLEATIDVICTTGIVHPPVYARSIERLPRLVLLEDRGGSMMPFHAFSDAVGEALQPRLHAYFSDLPAAPFHTDRERSDEVSEAVFDAALRDAPPLLILSDAGAGRRSRDPRRAAFIKAYLDLLPTRRIAWLNPLPRSRWERTTAALIAGFVPMFPLDDDGLRAAVVALRREK
jgi:uncharacterized protein